ncbi:MAG: ROK family protein [Planctomycetes bacterium]|nr:ROK family protein [Planctomycetota bacterium]
MPQPTLPADLTLIGVDGGATEVKAHRVRCDQAATPPAYSLLPAGAARKYQRVSGFAPLPVAEQLAQRSQGSVDLSPAEREQGAEWVNAACQAIVEVANTGPTGPAGTAGPVLIGMGMPGLKTPDGRGIEAINNGPRLPDYLDRLEQGLAAAGVELLCPVAVLGSDADYCGLGEQHAAEGLFRDVENAYYFGGGTGVADALKLRGRLIPFDEIKPWMLKSWQMPSALGPTFEKLVSAASLNEGYARLTPAASSADGGGRYPEQAAADGDPVAMAWMEVVAVTLAELIFERLDTIANGRRARPHRGEAYGKLAAEHDYRGTILDRVVIGQRIGQIYADPRYQAVFAERVDRCLAALLTDCDDANLTAGYLDGHRLKPELLRPSALRAAPALGAAVSAVQAHSTA